MNGDDVAFLDAARALPDMSVMELSVMIAAYRHPAADLPKIAERLSHWFLVEIVVPDLASSLRRLRLREWLDAEGAAQTPTEAGLEASRRLLGGMIRMIDGDRRLFDVGMMLQLTMMKEDPDEVGH